MQAPLCFLGLVGKIDALACAPERFGEQKVVVAIGAPELRLGLAGLPLDLAQVGFDLRQKLERLRAALAFLHEPLLELEADRVGAARAERTLRLARLTG
jgi:hypothetical protein